MVYWNEKFLVLSLIFPILRAPAPVPKYWKKNTAVCLYMFVCQSSWSNLFIPPANEVWGYIFVTLSVCPSVRLSVRLFVRPSICLSVCPSFHLSVCLSIHPSVHLSVCPSFYLSVCLFFCLSPVCGHDSKRWVHKFLWKSVHWLLTTCRCAPGIFILLYFTGFWIITRNSVLKIMKNFDLNIEKMLLWNWNFYLLLWFTILLKRIANFYSENWQWGRGCQIHFAGLTMYSGTMHLFDFLLLT